MATPVIRLAKWFNPALAVACLAIASVAFAIPATTNGTEFNLFGAVAVAAAAYAILSFVVTLIAQGPRIAKDRLMTTLVAAAFAVAVVPLISLISTVVTLGLARFDGTFFTSSMRNVVGEGGGALHAIIGTLEITSLAAIISIPIGMLTAIYLVEYGRGRLARAVTALVDVMTGIPSIVAGLFAFSLFALFFGPGVRMGFAGAVALSVLMVPVVVRSAEEMLRIVPMELREASFALGVPKWLTVLRVVLPTASSGLITGVMIAIARVIGETAPLLIVAGFTQSMNYNPFDERMMTLPVFVYFSYASQGADTQAYIDRAWAGALTLIVIVMALNLGARILSRITQPHTTR
ncbi:MAG: phosphate transporter permease PtsA [Actinomycetota bacterium]|jgi:phosphate transport system permease protein